jgi:hypothetical protein
MNDLPQNPAPDSKAAQHDEDRSGQGPNLFVAYGLMALALLVAIALAALIVWPFYKAR